MEEIGVFTNLEIAKQRANNKNCNSSNLKDTDLDEVRALFSILILRGALKDNHLSTDIMFNESFSGSRYVAIMSNVRLRFLVNCLRYDDVICVILTMSLLLFVRFGKC